MRSLTSARLRAAIFVGGASLALYLVTLAPTITWANFGADGGDLISAAVTLGVPHPPGYPLYITLGYLFAQLPIGNVAFRLNLFSAVCMALAAALTTWSVAGITPIPGPSPVDKKPSTGEGSKLPPLSAASRGRGRAGVGVLAGLAFAAAPMVWGQATIAEVHALNVLLVAAILALLAPIVFRGEPISTRRLSCAFFILGLSLTNQLTTLALVPLFFITLHRSLVTRHSSLVTRYALRFTHYALPFLLALTPYLLLLPRAAAQPPINWLGEATWASFWPFITAELYRGYAFALPLSEFPARMIAFAQLLVMQFGWIGLGLIGFGIYRARRHIVAPSITVALYVIFALGYNTADSQLYLIPVWLFGAYAIAAGAQILAHHAHLPWRAVPGSRTTHHVLRSTYYAHLPWRAVPGLLIILIPGLSILNNFAAQDLHADRSAENFARAVLAAAPADAIIITHRDAHTFTLWYYRHVEAQRPDVAEIDARLAAYPWYDPMLRAQNARRAQSAALNEVEFDPEATWLARLRAANPTRPLCDLDASTAQLICP